MGQQDIVESSSRYPFQKPERKSKAILALPLAGLLFDCRLLLSCVPAFGQISCSPRPHTLRTPPFSGNDNHALMITKLFKEAGCGSFKYVLI